MRLYKALLWLWTIVFVLQLAVSFVSHDHDFADDVADCVSCQVAGNAGLALHGAPPAVLATLLVVAYRVARLPEYVNIVPRLYLIPPRQAPPLHFAF